MKKGGKKEVHTLFKSSVTTFNVNKPLPPPFFHSSMLYFIIRTHAQSIIMHFLIKTHNSNVTVYNHIFSSVFVVIALGGQKMVEVAMGCDT